jgi:hypothetical protein
MQPKYLGDIASMTVHRPARVSPKCGVPEIPNRYKLGIHSAELVKHLVQAENWRICPSCLGTFDDVHDDR